MTDIPEDIPRRWASRKTAAAYMDVHPASLDRMAVAGKITRYKVGTLARYDLEEIDALVRAGAQDNGPAGTAA